jgi:hypothetical protein
MLRDGSASTFAWVEHVDDADRARFEHTTGITIKQMTPDGHIVAAGRRPTYDASRYVGQVTSSPTPLGVDAAADPARRRALRSVAQLDEPQATAVSRLVGSKSRASSSTRPSGPATAGSWGRRSGRSGFRSSCVR